MKKVNSRLPVLVCKYSPICDWNCLKCQWLKYLQIIYLDEENKEEESPFPT